MVERKRAEAEEEKKRETDGAEGTWTSADCWCTDEEQSEEFG